MRRKMSETTTQITGRVKRMRVRMDRIRAEFRIMGGGARRFVVGDENGVYRD